ncbi:cisplatin damage response ATP-dependent DNA ligase [Aestuariibacter sp. A3R04]|uniref:cisplatin damage response ATP-dependent DNA ligase n=1 Tax=Aestuariibacter sp. A3R04 TaxID=2841571 RepID=UPI001C08ED79|nr:cisplatin damage response ATP-dependent DNA ligase [Aestuariibacter sp. A3R04]MBU3023584.1 cisplatin damage response ATP-dependent DNA ligase [Aestuariibacter sp. A3R04]
MEAFSDLLEQLYFTSSNNAKAALIEDYLKRTPDPDRGWAIAAIAGELRFDFFKRNTIKTLVLEQVDDALFAMSYDYVGEMSETVAHLWQPTEEAPDPSPLPGLHALVESFSNANRTEVKPLLTSLLNRMTAAQRWALLKLGTRGLRVGVSARSIKHILARYGGVDVGEIEALWHGVAPPYAELLSWLDGKGEKPDISGEVTFHPVMLAHPIDEESRESIDPTAWQIEPKLDGIRVQLVSKPNGKALFSRTGDDISHGFPDLLDTIEHMGVLDGELLIMHGKDVDTFNQLQQRLNKRRPTKNLMQTLPAGMVVYDVLSLDGQSLTDLPLSARRQALEEFFEQQTSPRLHLSTCFTPSTTAALNTLHQQVCEDTAVEGLMLKRKDSLYTSGRPKGQWYKWKRDPLLVDAVIMYAQRGHGKRSSYYSDFTFGAWQNDTLLPIGKAYSGFTDEELKQLDNWVRRHTIGRFGPVKEVKKELVVEVAFDAVHPSGRHKSGVALRFPRIHRIRWDKPAVEADRLDTVKSLIEASQAD